MSTYGWIITTDHLAADGNVTPDESGTMGPRNITDELADALRAGQGRTFKMYDDDDELYYTGRILWTDEHDDYETGFEPLRDYGMPNAGCTGIRYPGSGPEYGSGRYL